MKTLLTAAMFFKSWKMCNIQRMFWKQYMMVTCLMEGWDYGSCCLHCFIVRHFNIDMLHCISSRPAGAVIILLCMCPTSLVHYRSHDMKGWMLFDSTYWNVSYKNSKIRRAFLKQPTVFTTQPMALQLNMANEMRKRTSFQTYPSGTENSILPVIRERIQCRSGLL